MMPPAVLPQVQPDRAWAEHLGMPRLVDLLREQEATIQRLIAQADALAATVTELAFQAWSGTQRCGDCYRRRTYCGRCLQVIDALTDAGFGDQMRDWAGA